MTSLVALITSWLITYMLHSTLLITGAYLLIRVRSPGLRTVDRVWKFAAFGGLFTSAAHTGPELFGFVFQSPKAGRVDAGPIVLVIWASGALLGLLALERDRRSLNRALGTRTEIIHPAIQGRLQTLLAQSQGYARPVRLTLSQKLSGPLVLPTGEICIPERALTELEPKEQTSMLAHELSHLRRADPFWLLAFHALARLLWFQPLNRLARTGFEANAEYICDAWASEQSGDPIATARCLTKVATWLSQDRPPVIAPAMAGKRSARSSGLGPRVRRLLEGQRSERERPLAVFVLLILLSAAAPTITIAPPPSGCTAAE